MVQSGSGEPAKVLDQARRRRVIKPADERRREILEAAGNLFRERGFEATTVQAVAAVAGMAAGTVYLYFPSKEAILLALQEDFQAGLIERFAEISDAVLKEEDASGEVIGYEEVVSRLIDGVVDFSLEHRAEAEVIARHAGRLPIASTSGRLNAPLTELLARVIREGVNQRYVHVSDPEMAAYLLNTASSATIGHAIAFGDDRELARVVRACRELYIKALAPSDD